MLLIVVLAFCFTVFSSFNFYARQLRLKFTVFFALSSPISGREEGRNCCFLLSWEESFVLWFSFEGKVILSFSLLFSIWCFLSSGSVFRCVSLSLSLYFVCFCQRLIACLSLISPGLVAAIISGAGLCRPVLFWFFLAAAALSLAFTRQGRGKKIGIELCWKLFAFAGTRAKWQKRRREGGKREEKSGHLDLYTTTSHYIFCCCCWWRWIE